MKNYSVPEGTLNAVLAYLGTRPYVDVANLVDSIRSQSKEIVEASDEAPQSEPSAVNN